MYEEKIVLCGANSYEEKYYLNPDFSGLPDHIKDELKIMCVLYVNDVGGVLTLVYEENGELCFEVTSEEFDPMFLEEPVLCENMEAFSEIAAACNIPIATGERLYSRWDFKRLLHAGGVDIIQPDLSHAGGITEVKKIASMAEAYDVALAPHCPLGPIALAACLNVDATCYNAVIQEQSIGIHYNVGKSVLDYVNNREDFEFTDGFVKLPRKPGLGVEVNKELVEEENRTPHNWKNPVWRHADGSIAEW